MQGGRMISRVHKSLVCLLVLASAVALYGQGGAVGTILGTVSDSQGAVVAAADVEVTNTATNISKKTQTSDTGDFTVPSLNPGPTSLALSTLQPAFYRGEDFDSLFKCSFRVESNIQIKAITVIRRSYISI